MVAVTDQLGYNMKKKHNEFGQTNEIKKQKFRDTFDKFLESINFRRFTKKEFIEYAGIKAHNLTRGLKHYMSLKQQEIFQTLCYKVISKPQPRAKSIEKLNYEDIVQTLSTGNFSSQKLARHYHICTSTLNIWLNSINKAQSMHIRSLYKRDVFSKKKLVDKKINRKWKYDSTPDNIKLPIGLSNAKFK